jgi:hypothetical protein
VFSLATRSEPTPVVGDLALVERTMRTPNCLVVWGVAATNEACSSLALGVDGLQPARGAGERRRQKPVGAHNRVNGPNGESAEQFLGERVVFVREVWTQALNNTRQREVTLCGIEHGGTLNAKSEQLRDLANTSTRMPRSDLFSVVVVAD